MASSHTSSPLCRTSQLKDVLLSWQLVLMRWSRAELVPFEWSPHPCDGRSHGTWTAIDLREGQDSSLSGESSVDFIRGSLETSLGALHSHEATPTRIILSTGTGSEQQHSSATDGPIKVSIGLLDDGTISVGATDEDMPSYRSHVTARYIAELQRMYQIIPFSGQTTVRELITASPYDLDQIWTWNAKLPETYNDCMHNVVARIASQTPEKTAIDSWDGTLSYKEVDDTSSRLAHHLVSVGVVAGDIVLVCFEKSRWTTVAALAVSKAGGTIVLLDPLLPPARLKEIARQTEAKTIISSAVQNTLSQSIIDNGTVIVLNEATAFDTGLSILPSVDPDVIMYIIFTSGSTGTPKGVLVSHRSFTSSSFPRAEVAGYRQESRVLDFASYAFDVSIDSMMLTLARGGTLCIPDEDARLADINHVIRSMQITFAALTPSLARLLENDVLSSLSTLVLGGEAASAREVAIYGQRTRVAIGYGPCECTIGCTVNGNAANGKPQVSIGTGNGASIWLVDPDNHNTLVAVGAVGELLVEGPIVGQGYLNDPEKTNSAFIQDPVWLVEGHASYPGRSGRLYKTGDLARYDLDGSGEIIFVGRKEETQVKLRGQRIELGEIESQIKTNLPSTINAVAEVIKPNGQATLACFISQHKAPIIGADSMAIASLSSEAQSHLQKARASISTTLPRYMVPTAWIPVTYIPALISGKTNRRQLRAFGSTIDISTLDDVVADVTSTEPVGVMGNQLREIWAELLRIEPGTITSGSNFFSLGADSLVAMKLVATCNARGLTLSVANVFEKPTLSGMETLVKIATPAQDDASDLKPLLLDNLSEKLKQAATACELEPGLIEDIFPCSPVQEALFTFSMRSDTPYTAQRIAKIPDHVSSEALRHAWKVVVARNAILRTRIVHFEDSTGLHQVVTKPAELNWATHDSVEQYLRVDQSRPMKIGDGLCRFAIVQNGVSQRTMVWTIHHAVYDGYSEPLILDQLEAILATETISLTHAAKDMKDFVAWLSLGRTESTAGYWAHQLSGASGRGFPHAPRDHLSHPDGFSERYVSCRMPTGIPFTLATIIRGAWALISSQYTLTTDIVFGETLMGRDIDLPGVETIVGPIIATVPTRIQFDEQQTVHDYLQAVAFGHRSRMRHQHFGWHNIRKVSIDARIACETGCGIVIQPDVQSSTAVLGFDRVDTVQEALKFNPYSLMLAFGLQQHGFRVRASYDSTIIGHALVERLLAQVEITCLRLVTNMSEQLQTISCLPADEVDRIWEERAMPPLPQFTGKGHIPTNDRLRMGAVYPPVSHRWVCNPRTGQLSPIDGTGEMWIEMNAPLEGAVKNPGWLLRGSTIHPGRTGLLHKSGDLVQNSATGALVYMGQVPTVDREALFPPELSTCLRETLSTPFRVLCKTQPTKNIPIVLLEDSGAKSGDCMLYNHGHRPPPPWQICSSVSRRTLQAIQQFQDAWAQRPRSDVFSPILIVVQEALEDDNAQRNLLDWLSEEHLQTLQDDLRNVCAKSRSAVELTANERVLQTCWAAILPSHRDTIGPRDNFFRLGGDSILAMKLSSLLLSKGFRLTVADTFQNMLLQDAAKAMKDIGPARTDGSSTYKAFSLMGSTNTEAFVNETICPRLSNDQWTIEDVAPATETQAHDVQGAVGELKTAIEYIAFRFNQSWDLGVIQAAIDAWIKRHQILRTVFVEADDRLWQVVVRDPVTRLEPVTWPGAEPLHDSIASFCNNDSEQEIQMGTSFLKTWLISQETKSCSLVLRLSHAQYDGISLPSMLADLDRILRGHTIVESIPFSRYVAYGLDATNRAAAEAYWRQLLHGSTLSTWITSLTSRLGSRSLLRRRAIAKPRLLATATEATLLVSAWALVLRRESGKEDITFGNVTSGRDIEVDCAEKIVGPCYAQTPVRVQFKPVWTILDLIQAVHRQRQNSSAHDFLGHELIVKNCTDWDVSASRAPYYGFVTHHIRDEGEIDSFGGMDCKVDVLNPHGVSAWPPKILMFTEGKKTSLGVVGAEGDACLLDNMLSNLDQAVAFLTSETNKRLEEFV